MHFKNKFCIVVSGLLPKNPEEYRKQMQDAFGNVFDIYYAAWNHEDQEKYDWIDFFDDVEMHYNPYKDNLKRAVEDLRNGVEGQDRVRAVDTIKDRKKSKHRSKQILIHGKEIEHLNLNRKYSVIVRFRWDLEWCQELTECLKNAAYCVDDTLKVACYLPNNSEDFDPKLSLNFGDCIIAHHASRFNTEYMWKLHEEKRLEGGESGWWQMLCVPYKEKPMQCFEGYIKLKSDLLKPGIRSFFNPPFKLTHVKFDAERSEEARKDLVWGRCKIPVYPSLDKPIRVAVIFSGKLPKQHVSFPEKNIQKIREMLPYADIFCTTWDTEPPKHYINRYYREPEVLNSSRNVYKNYLKMYRAFKESDWDIKSLPESWHNMHPEKAKTDLKAVLDKRQGFANQNKQHLAYALAYKDFITEDHDVVIRMRYDTEVQDSLEPILQNLCEHAYSDKKVLGFHHFTLKLIDILDPRAPHEEVNVCASDSHVNTCLRDFMIIHRADQFDPMHVFELYEDKKLAFAEHGWWQILCKPNGLEHKHFLSFVKLDHQKGFEDRVREKYKHLDIHRDYAEMKKIDETLVHAIIPIATTPSEVGHVQ